MEAPLGGERRIVESKMDVWKLCSILIGRGLWTLCKALGFCAPAQLGVEMDFLSNPNSQNQFHLDESRPIIYEF